MVAGIKDLTDFRSFLPILKANPERFKCKSQIDLAELLLGLGTAYNPKSTEADAPFEDSTLIQLRPCQPISKYFAKRVGKLEPYLSPQTLLAVPYGESRLGLDHLIRVIEDYYLSKSFVSNSFTKGL